MTQSFKDFLQEQFQEWVEATGRPPGTMPAAGPVDEEIKKTFMEAVERRDIFVGKGGTFTFGSVRSNQPAKKPYSFFSETRPRELNRRYLLLVAALSQLQRE